MQQIGIFADNFNPINLGYINFLKIIKKKYKLNKIIIIINNKKISQTSNDITIEKKKILCKIAIKNLNFIQLYPEKVTKFNTIFQILTKIQKDNQTSRLYFIVWPTDLPYLSNIYNVKKLSAITKIISAAPANMVQTLSNNSYQIPITPAEFKIISSRNLRVMLSLQKDCSVFMNKEMLEFIQENGIYIGKKYLLLECNSICKQNTSKIRFLHCKLVSKAAKDLAKLYNEDETDAAIAGLMHDVMKEKSQEHMLNIFNFYNFKLNETQQSNPKVWHGIAGALYMENILKIDIKHIINAVKYHTVPRKNMTKFEKIIFIADRISDDRIYKDVNILRSLAKKDLDASVLYSLKNTISSLLKKENTISTPTIECYNNLILKKRRKFKYANKS